MRIDHTRQRTSLERIIGQKEAGRLFDAIERIRNTKTLGAKDNADVRSSTAAKPKRVTARDESAGARAPSPGLQQVTIKNSKTARGLPTDEDQSASIPIKAQPKRVAYVPPRR